MKFNEFTYKFEKEPVINLPHEVPRDVLVSVCVQTYKHKDFITSCLDGILTQETSFQFEILLGEDASNDGTREICLTYAKKYPNKIRLFLHSRANNISINGSPSGRFNTLYNLFQANGKYIALCEGDDYWTDKNKLQRQVDFLENNNEFNLVSHNMAELNESTGIRKSIVSKSQTLGFSDFIQHGVGGVYTCSMLFRNNSTIQNVIFSEHAFRLDGLDQLILLAASKGRNKVAVLEERMAVYRIHSGGVWSSGNRKVQALQAFTDFDQYNKIEGFEYSEKKLFKLFKVKGVLWMVRFNELDTTNLPRKVLYKLLYNFYYKSACCSKLKYFITDFLDHLFKKRKKNELAKLNMVR